MEQRPAPASLTRAQVRELDRIAISELGIPGVVLMENAGRGAAEELLAALAEGRLAPPGPRPPRVLVLCGSGNNAGDGYVVARHLSNAGLAPVLVETVEPDRLSPDAAVFRRVTRAMGLEHRSVPDAAAWRALAPELEGAGLLVDALLGTGFRGAMREPLASLVGALSEFAAAGGRTVVALDTPSGLDVDSGEARGPVLRAGLTLTFAALKKGFAREGARGITGEVRVVGIGAPPGLVERVRREA